MDPDLIEKREEFREHLTLGIVRALCKVPNIRDVVLAEHQPSGAFLVQFPSFFSLISVQFSQITLPLLLGSKDIQLCYLMSSKTFI